MAKIVFRAPEEHDCGKELHKQFALEARILGDVARCSCGKFFVWAYVDQKAMNWVHVSKEDAIDLILRWDKESTRVDAIQILDQE